jgi:hypothetical protein
MEAPHGPVNTGILHFASKQCFLQGPVSLSLCQFFSTPPTPQEFHLPRRGVNICHTTSCIASYNLSVADASSPSSDIPYFVGKGVKRATGLTPKWH